MLHTYVSFLQQGNCSDSTIVNHLSSISKWINYLIDFADQNVPIKFLKQLEALQKGLRKDAKKKRKWKAKEQKSKMIESNCWPKNGLSELIGHLKRF